MKPVQGNSQRCNRIEKHASYSQKKYPSPRIRIPLAFNAQGLQLHGCWLVLCAFILGKLLHDLWLFIARSRPPTAVGVLHNRQVDSNAFVVLHQVLHLPSLRRLVCDTDPNLGFPQLCPSEWISNAVKCQPSVIHPLPVIDISLQVTLIMREALDYRW